MSEKDSAVRPDLQTRGTKPIAGTMRALFANARWALNISWSTSPGLTLMFIGLSFVISVLPAAQALATRALINVAVHELRVGGVELRPILPWLLLAFVATISDGLGRLCLDFSKRRLEDDLNLELNSTILSHAARLDVSFFEDPGSEDTLYRAKQNPARNFTRFMSGVLGSFSNLVQIVSLLAIVVAIEPLVLLVLIPAVLPYLRFQWKLSRTRYELERSRATKRRWTHYFVSRLTDSSSVPEVKILDLGPLLIHKFRSLMTEIRDQDHGMLKRSLRAAALFSTGASLAIYALFARVALRVLGGSATMGDLAIFGAATARLRSTLENEIDSLAGMLEEMLTVSDLQELLAATPSMVSTPVPAVIERYRGELVFQGVSFSYPDTLEPILHDISLIIRPGETLALVGENGCGKTTLAKLIARFYDPTAGCVRLDGHDLRTLDPHDLRSRISFVFQNFGRYEATIADNIAYGDWQRLLGEEEQIERVATEAGVADMIRSLSDGYKTVIGRNFGRFDLSSGQWQQVALARAFARQTSLFVLDEPSSNLDPLAEHEMLARLRSLSRGRTTLIISHRFSTVLIADRIAVMERGRIVEVGSHDQLLLKGGQYARLYDRARRSDHPAFAMPS